MPKVCAHTETDVVIYMIKCLLERDGASVGMKNGGQREETYRKISVKDHLTETG